MPRGENPNSKANLAKGNKFNAETARRAKKLSDESKAKRKTLREELLVLLSEKDTQTCISKALIEQARNGNTKAFEVIRDTVGEKPVERVEQATVEISVEFEEDGDTE